MYVLPTDTCLGMACAISDVKSYHRIYRLKHRPLNKPLAIMVWDYDWLRDNTTLTREQIEFLENYERPFSILTNAPNIEMLIWFDEWEFIYENKDVYDEMSIRVASNPIEMSLIEKVWPIFLTSANISGEKELYSMGEAKEVFDKYKKYIEFLWWDTTLDSGIKPSDIFWFVWDTLEIEYLRRL